MTQKQLINILLSQTAPKSINKILKDIVDKDIKSTEKFKMQKSLNYYYGNNDILEEKPGENNYKGSITEQYWREQIKTVNNYHAYFVNEKVDFLLGKPASISADNENLVDTFKNMVSDETLNKTAQYARIFGKAYWQVYFDRDGEFNYKLHDTREIIPIYRDGKLAEVIRYYYQWINDIKTLKVEYWTQQGMAAYTEDKYHNLIADYTENTEVENGQYNDMQQSHFQIKDENGNIISNENFKFFPFIEFTNGLGKTDLDDIKTYIDNIDIILSDAVVDVKTFKEIYAAISGFDAQLDNEDNVRRFWEYFRKYRMAISGDAESKVNFKQVEIPIEAKKWLIDTLEQQMFRIASSPRKTMESQLGNLSGTALKILQNPLRLSVSKQSLSFKSALKKFSEFLNEYTNVQGELSINFNYNMMANDLETVQALAMSQGLISKRTLLENHPYVVDVDEELERLNSEVNIDTFGVDEQ